MMAIRFNAAESNPSPSARRLPAPRVSHVALGSFVALIEGALILIGSVAGQFGYEWGTGRAGQLDIGSGLGLLAGLIYIYFAYAANLYHLKVLLHPMRYFRRIVRTCLFGLVSLTAVMFLLKISTELSRGASLVFAGLFLVLCVLARLGLAGWIRSLLLSGAVAGRPAFVLGETSELSHLPAGYLLQQFGVSEVGRFPLELAAADSDTFRTESFRDAIGLSRVSHAKEFLVVSRWDSPSKLKQIEEELRVSPLRVVLLPNFVLRTAISRSTSNEDVASRLIELQRAPMSMVDRAVKRSVDLVIATFALVAIAPILVATSLAIKLDSPGPVIFRQRRNGFNQKQFVIYKFRTMTVLEDGREVVQARRNDRRITRVGQFLRRSSIDELPQLFNVLKGEMSLVGPRPHALAHDDHYTELIDDYCMRHHVKPGITGWAQVNGFRGETAREEQMKKRVDLDLFYINNRSLLLDFRIMVRTCTELFKHDAY